MRRSTAYQWDEGTNKTWPTDRRGHNRQLSFPSLYWRSPFASRALFLIKGIHRGGASLVQRRKGAEQTTGEYSIQKLLLTFLQVINMSGRSSNAFVVLERLCLCHWVKQGTGQHSWTGYHYPLMERPHPKYFYVTANTMQSKEIINTQKGQVQPQHWHGHEIQQGLH